MELQERVEINVVINIPHLSRSLPEHSPYVLAHNPFIMDAGRCSSLNDFVYLLPNRAHRIGDWEFGSAISTANCFLGILNLSDFPSAV